MKAYLEGFMKALLIAIFVLCSFPALADTDDAKMKRLLSAAFILDACKEKPSEPAFWKGRCFGQIEMLYLLAFGNHLGPDARFCPPDDVSINQARKVIIKYIDERPEQLHRLFFDLAIDALRKVWPCPKP
jgi:hypothetical protein